MTLLVRDEADVLESHLEYHLSLGVDHIVAMDNCSVDQTSEILQRYEAMGRVTYLHQPADNYAQGEWVTTMARMAATELGADWVINSDADEFWWPAGGDLKTVLREVEECHQGVLVDRVNFLPPVAGEEGDFAETMTLRETRATNLLGRPLLPKLCHRACNEIEIEQGNHGAKRKGRPLRTTTAPLEILHFPMRSYRQFANKIECGGAAYQRNQVLQPSIGSTWRRMYELYLRNELGNYFDQLVPRSADIREGLRSGRFVRDTRLKHALAALRESALTLQ